LARDPRELDDRALVEEFRRGDQAAFSELMRRHEERIFALALRMTGNRADALDATQDTFILAFRKADMWRGDSAYGTWLYRVGINACLDLLRKKKREALPEGEPREEDESRYGAPGVEETVTTRMAVRDALAALPEDYREAVAMHDLGGIPYQEIARLTGAEIGTVKSRISRGRARLARLLEPTPAPESSKDSR
jgi:RNA polymerase sigma-70 factor (ECF subfamily)